MLLFFFLEENLAAAITGKQNPYISGLYSSKKDVVLNEVRKSVSRYIRQTTGVGYKGMRMHNLTVLNAYKNMTPIQTGREEGC